MIDFGRDKQEGLVYDVLDNPYRRWCVRASAAPAPPPDGSTEAGRHATSGTPGEAAASAVALPRVAQPGWSALRWCSSNTKKLTL